MAPSKSEEFCSNTQGMSMQVPNFALKEWINRPKEIVLSLLIPHDSLCGYYLVRYSPLSWIEYGYETCRLKLFEELFEEFETSWFHMSVCICDCSACDVPCIGDSC